MRAVYKWLLVVFLAGVLILAALVLYRTWSPSSRQMVAGAVNLPPVSLRADSILAEAIRIPTISYDDRTLIDTMQFQRLHALLERAFPLVHATLTRTRIHSHSLLFTWPGRKPGLRPVLFLAHQDVVPVEPGTEKEWEFPPFGGVLAGGFINGRGSLDDKLSVVGILQAAEMLISSGFKPERTLMFAFGHDEEIAGTQGAVNIVRYLENQNIRARFILDEGLVVARGIVPGISKPVALIGTAEKGYMTARLDVSLEGGHSAMPAKENAVTRLNSALYRLHHHPFPMEITPPVQGFMEYLGPELPFPMNMAFANPWLFKGLIFNEYDKLNSGRALLQTSMVPTVLQAGVKENQVPAHAQALVNFRILPGHSSLEIIEQVRHIIADDQVRVTPLGLVTEATPPSSTDSAGFRAIQQAAGLVFPEALVAPSLVIITTDSRHYGPISDNIYKFLPLELTQADLRRIHGANERVASADFHRLIQFYRVLMDLSGRDLQEPLENGQP